MVFPQVRDSGQDTNEYPAAGQLFGIIGGVANP